MALHTHNCLYCGLDFQSRDLIRKFCNSSHAALFNNNIRDETSRKQQVETLKATLSKKPKKIKSIIEIDLNLYPKVNHAVIKYTSIFLNKDNETITYDDVDIFRDWLIESLHTENLSPADIAKILKIDHINFSSFIKDCMNIKLKSLKLSIRNYVRQIGTIITDEKIRYWKDCKFTFDPYKQPKIIGFELLGKIPWYDSLSCKDGLCRDHMISIHDGWNRKIDPTLISHPANCHIMKSIDNFTKNKQSSITLDDLLIRIENW